jgi:hypothetical protein
MSNTCTVVVSGDGSPCGQPAVASFTSKRSGATYYECADHCAGVHEPVGHARVTAKSMGLKTRTTKPFVLVDGTGRIVGYADSDGPLVKARAMRQFAVVVPTR